MGIKAAEGGVFRNGLIDDGTRSKSMGKLHDSLLADLVSYGFSDIREHAELNAQLERDQNAREEAKKQGSVSANFGKGFTQQAQQSMRRLPHQPRMNMGMQNDGMELG